MFERFTDQARLAVVDAQKQARQLRHGYIGGEHLLLGVVSSADPAGEALRDLGLTPTQVQSAIRQLIAGSRPSPTLDREALAAIGIDLDLVQERIEATFGPGALTRPPSRNRRRRCRRPGQNNSGSGHLPFTPRAKKCLERSLREASILHDKHIGVEHLALALASMPDGVPPRIFATLGISEGQIRIAVLDKYRQAG